MKKHWSILVLTSAISLCSHAATPPSTQDFIAGSEQIKATYQQHLLSLPPFKLGHYAIRMYRQTGDSSYQTGIWVDTARVASNLNRIANELYSPLLIDQASKNIDKRYQNSDPVKESLRKKTLQQYPEYIELAVNLIGSMARADELGLKHIQDDKLRALLNHYDFKNYATDPDMIKAWAAQLSNQVYWLKQLGVQDIVGEYTSAFKKTYPDHLDAQLTDQQYANKIYGLTHIIIAASGYYQHSINEKDYQWVYDYFRSNIDTIIARTKEDVIAESGIVFLLAGLNDDPALIKTQRHILNSIDPKHNMVLSTTGSADISKGEHRNVLSAILLNWQGTNSSVNIQQSPHLFPTLPYGLVAK